MRTLRLILSLAVAAPAALAVWGLIPVGTTLAGSAGKPVAVFTAAGSDAALAAVFAAGGSILEIRENAVIAIGDDPGFVLRLYEQGSLLVVATRGAGCGARFATAWRSLA